MKGRSKIKGRAGDNCQRTLNIEFKQDWSVGLGATVGDPTRRIENFKKYFVATKIFPGKPDSAIFLRFKCTINPENLMKSLEPFWKK